MKVVYAPTALRDIDDILAYIHQRNPIGARNVSLAIEYNFSCAGFGGSDALAELRENLFARNALATIEFIDGSVKLGPLDIAERRVDRGVAPRFGNLCEHLDAVVGEGCELGPDQIDGLRSRHG
jgi:hypothetical protein